MEKFKTYILPFVVLTILIQTNQWIDEYTLKQLYYPGKNIITAKDKFEKVTLTRTAIAFTRIKEERGSLFHFADPEFPIDFNHLGKYKIEIFPKGTEFELLGGQAGSDTLFRKNGKLYVVKESRIEYSIYKPTTAKIYQGTMHVYMVPEFERFAEDLESKILNNKFPINVKICRPPVDAKIGRRLNEYGDSEKLFQQILNEFYDRKQAYMVQYKFDKKVSIIDRVLVPVNGYEAYMFCALFEFKDVEAYVAFQNLPE